jgi:hypothetical protein
MHTRAAVGHSKRRAAPVFLSTPKGEGEVIVLDIPEPTPSMNALLGRHWSHRKKEREKWGWLVKAALNRLRLAQRPNWDQARVTIERYGARILDSDNFRGGTKFVTDSLVTEGIITDDKPSVIGEPILRQFIAPANRRRTVVIIEPVMTVCLSEQTVGSM